MSGAPLQDVYARVGGEWGWGEMELHGARMTLTFCTRVVAAGGEDPGDMRSGEGTGGKLRGGMGKQRGRGGLGAAVPEYAFPSPPSWQRSAAARARAQPPPCACSAERVCVWIVSAFKGTCVRADQSSRHLRIVRHSPTAAWRRSRPGGADAHAQGAPDQRTRPMNSLPPLRAARRPLPHAASAPPRWSHRPPSPRPALPVPSSATHFR